jgi:hypothetical protein
MLERFMASSGRLRKVHDGRESRRRETGLVGNGGR